MPRVFLSLPLTLARTPWFADYATTTRRWGLEALADQPLAGVIMWVPAGMIYVAVGLALLVVWLRETEDGAVDRADAIGSAGSSTPLGRSLARGPGVPPSG